MNIGLYLELPAPPLTPARVPAIAPALAPAVAPALAPVHAPAHILPRPKIAKPVKGPKIYMIKKEILVRAYIALRMEEQNPEVVAKHRSCDLYKL